MTQKQRERDSSRPILNTDKSKSKNARISQVKRIFITRISTTYEKKKKDFRSRDQVTLPLLLTTRKKKKRARSLLVEKELEVCW